MELFRVFAQIFPWYLLTVLIETPVLLIGLARRHSLKRRLFAGIWLTACTYPGVNIVIPYLLSGAPDIVQAVTEETFAPLAECLLFWLAFRAPDYVPREMWRDFAAIIAANLTSFALGEIIKIAIRTG